MPETVILGVVTTELSCGEAMVSGRVFFEELISAEGVTS